VCAVYTRASAVRPFSLSLFFAPPPPATHTGRSLCFFLCRPAAAAAERRVRARAREPCARSPEGPEEIAISRPRHAPSGEQTPLGASNLELRWALGRNSSRALSPPPAGARRVRQTHTHARSSSTATMERPHVALALLSRRAADPLLLLLLLFSLPRPSATSLSFFFFEEPGGAGGERGVTDRGSPGAARRVHKARCRPGPRSAHPIVTAHDHAHNLRIIEASTSPVLRARVSKSRAPYKPRDCERDTHCPPQIRVVVVPLRLRSARPRPGSIIEAAARPTRVSSPCPSPAP
jgi:hypothetical protein